MANTAITVYHGQLGVASATLYTVPASTKLIVSEINLCNTDAVARTITIRYIPSGGVDDATNNIYQAYSLAAGETVTIGHNTVLEAAYVIKGMASAASVVNIHISGMTIT